MIDLIPAQRYGLYKTLPKKDPYAMGTLCGMVPHATQNEFIVHPAPEKVGCCGRRWGKTKGEALEAIMFALEHPETQIYIVAPSQDQSNIIFGMIESMLVGVMGLFLLDLVHSPFPMATFSNGSQIHARSEGYDGKYLRGHHADFVIYDEASFLPRRIVEEVVPQMMITSLFKKVVKISTPFGRNHFYEDYQRGLGGDIRYQSFHYPSWANPYVNMETLAEEKRHRSALAWAVEYCALFRDDQTAFFQWRAVKKCISDEMDYPAAPMPNRKYCIGYDPARLHDRSAICVLDVTEYPFTVVYLDDLHGRSYGIQEEMVQTISERYNNAPVHVDSTKHDQLAERLQDLVKECYGYIFSNENKHELHEGTAIAFEHRELIIPRHPDLIRELQFFEVKTTQASNVMKLGAPEGSDHWDDYVTALGLAVSLGRYQMNHKDSTVSMLNI